MKSLTTTKPAAAEWAKFCMIQANTVEPYLCAVYNFRVPPSCLFYGPSVA